ncbi:MAG: hypothetical protein V4492_07740 [Chlamydiota bacterium]
MRLLMTMMAMVIGAIGANAHTNFADVYPPVVQTIVETSPFRGDRHGQFRGDDVVVLSDGSAWKVHPKSKDTYRKWYLGDRIHVSLRTDWYWFKREHKFFLNNLESGEKVKVMCVQHKYYPLTIVGMDHYCKSYGPTWSPQTELYTDQDGRLQSQTVWVYGGKVPKDYRKILVLSDGSTWVIKNHINDFQLGMKVFVGAQGAPGRFYDFVLIAGDEREAVCTLARPQK